MHPDPELTSVAAVVGAWHVRLDSTNARLDQIEAEIAELKQLFAAEDEDGS